MWHHIQASNFIYKNHIPLNIQAKNFQHLKSQKKCAYYVNVNVQRVKEKNKLNKLTCDNRQRRESIWFLATESPMKAIFLPRTILRKILGSNIGSSHCSGFHFQLRKSLSILPCLKQFLLSGIVGQLEFV